MNELLKQLDFKSIFFDNISFDKQTIESAINDLSRYLLKNVNSSSPFIIFTTHNHIKSIIVYYAILKIEKIAILLDPNIKNIELDEILIETNPCAFISINPNIISFDYSNEIVFRPDNKKFIINTDLTDVCTIAYTNAEDGVSKGAMITVNNLLSEVYPMIKTNKLNSESITYAFLPFFHLYGLIQGILAPTHAKSKSIITRIDSVQIMRIINEIEKHKVTHFYSVPSVYYILSKVPNIEKSIISIKEFYSGGIHLSQYIFEQFNLKTNRKIREGYGLTESTACSAYNYQNEDPVVNSFGIPFPGCEIKIINKLNLESSPNEEGEIYIKGETIFKGYFNNENETKKVVNKGWLLTGDLGKKDSNGYFYFTGLKKEMINMAGNNVYPKKIERLIKLNSNVEKVEVYGETSIVHGHTVATKIKLKNNSYTDQELLKNWCFQNINNTIIPKKWLFE